MHRTIEITVQPAVTSWLVGELEKMEHVIGLSAMRGASIKPAGDVIVVHALNRGVDEVLRCADRASGRGPISIVTAEVASIIDPAHRDAVDDDVDEAIWEEAETGLRHQGRITQNYLALMAIGGVVASIGLVSDPVPQAVAFVAAAVIAPGFEPLARIPLGLVLGRWNVIRRGLLSVAAGYAVLVVAAALAFAFLRWTGATTVEALAANPEVAKISHPTALEVLLSACGAVAGLVMILAYRQSVIAGPLIALIIVPAAALIGAAGVAGRWSLAVEGLQRLALDAVLIVGLGAVVVLIKQLAVHRRRPLV